MSSDGPINDAWKALARTVPSHAKHAAWEALAIAAGDSDFIDSNASELSRLILDTLNTINDTATHRIIAKSIRKCLKSDPFLQEFTAGLVKATSVSSAKRIPPGAALTLMSWSSLVLQRLDLETSQKAISKLIDCQVLWLEALLSAGIRRLSAVQGSITTVLNEQPTLFDNYLSAAMTTGSAPLVRALWVYASRHGNSVAMAEVAPKLLEIFIDKALSAKERPSQLHLDCYRYLLHAATSEHVSQLLLPAAVRMIRRSPEAALGTVAYMLSSLNIDLDASIAEILPVLIQQSRHAKEPVRKLAIEAAAAFITKVSDPATLQTAVESVCKVLGGTSDAGKIKSPQERVSLAAMLETFSNAPRVSNSAASATASVDFVCKFYKEEITEDGKVALLRAAGAWLPHCDSLPGSWRARLTDGLKEKEALKRGHLRAMVQGLAANESLRGNIDDSEGLAGVLSKIVQEGIQKVAARVDGILALLVASYIASEDATVQGYLDKEGIWTNANLASSLVASKTTALLTAPDVSIQAQLCSVLLEMHSSRIGGISSPAATAAAETLVLSLLHYSYKVRTASSVFAQKIASTSAEHGVCLLKAVQYWANHASDVSILVEPAPSSSGAAMEAPPMALVAVHERYFDAFLSCIPRHNDTRTISPDNLALSLLLAHHPMIAGARRGGSTWRSASLKMGGTRAVSSSLLSGMDYVIGHIVKSDDGITSDIREKRIAALGAIQTISRLAAAEAFQPLMAGIAPLLDRAEHDALTAKQLKVYATPRGRLSNENEDGSIIPGEMFEEMLKDKAAIEPPLFPPAVPTTPEPSSGSQAVNGSVSGSVTTGKPGAASRASSLRPSQQGTAAKPRAEKKDAATEARERQLKGEAEIRNGIVAIRERLSRGLEAIGSFGRGNPAFTGVHLQELASTVLPLLTSPIVGGTAALETTRELAASIPGPPGYHALDVAAALRLVAITDAQLYPDYQSLASSSCVATTIQALMLATGGRPATEDYPSIPGNRPLSDSVYTFCFPVLRAVLRCPRPTVLHDAALSVISLHVGPDAAVPKPQAFQLLYHVVEILPAYRDRVQILLETLCSTIQADDVDALLAALQGILSGQQFARSATLTALDAAPALSGAQPPNNIDVISLSWIAAHDIKEEISASGKALWSRSGAVLPADFIIPVAKRLKNQHEEVYQAAAAALADGVGGFHQGASGKALAATIDVYRCGDSRAARLGSAAALKALAPHLTAADFHVALDFLLSAGLVDDDGSVRSDMVSAGVAIVDAAGPGHAESMLPLFESYLERKAASDGLTEDQYDHVRQGAVVFVGTCARHLDPANPKVKTVVQTLIEVLRTPSEAVQRSVSDCLPALAQALNGADAAFLETSVKSLLKQALQGETYGDRRGAAYGLAGVVKGLGLSALKGYGIMDALKAGVEDKKDANAREGALCCYECLSDKLARLFEPYVVAILPMLLTAMGDASMPVREAANGASRVIMGQLSAQGVKLVLPKLLDGVEERIWRTKEGAIQLLGAMAHLAPKQLSGALPIIVPRLSEGLADPHPKVAAAAKKALDEVGSVIRNPEVSKLVPMLLAAIANPDKHNKKALDTLLSTIFVNTVDAASLALVAPVVHRGLRDRSGDVKKRAARIVGNLCKLINDPKDMAPYVPMLLPEIQAALVDPLPEVRATAARAFGALTLGMGVEHTSDQVPWLLETMRSEGSAVERSGAAQGLAEVLAVQGASGLETVLPEVIEACSARSAATREGSLTLFKYLPYCMADAFRPHLPEMLPCVLNGLADEAEGVRDAAMSAGRVAVELYSTSALPLLLPAVEAGTMNANWRIRQSSIELLGNLLFKVAGTTGRIQQDVHDDETEGISVEAHGAAIIEALGMTKRNEVLARIYMARSDVAYAVRSAALHVWKTLVTNTPKTLAEIMSALMDHVIQGLASGEEERCEMAGRCLGELVRKMGDRVLPQIMPILKEGMSSEEPATRAGVCEGLREVMENSTRTQLAEHLPDILPAVQESLCDEDADVRAAAGGVINVLFKSSGGGAMDTVIPSLLSGLDSGNEAKAQQALEGLRVVLGVRPQLLSAMAPRLIKPPLTAANLRALGALAEVAGPAIHSHLSMLIPPMLTLAGDHPDVSPAVAAAHEALKAIAGAIHEDGVHVYMGVIHKGLDDPVRRRGAANAIISFCKVTKLDYQEHVPGLISSLVPLLTVDDNDTLVSLWEALSAVMASIPKEMAPSFVRTLKEAVALAKEREKRKRKDAGTGDSNASILVPGFCLPKALTPVLPVYLQGVLQGSSAELRELAAEGLGELIEVTGEDSLKPFVVQITGPLIRIIGDRFPWQTKAAILRTMGLLVSRAGAGLRPFIPQLQSTFVKCLADQARGVRQRAALNLGELTKMALRLDQLVVDLAIGAKTAEPMVQEAYMMALEGALLASGDRLSAETLDKVGEAGKEVLAASVQADDEVVIRAAAGVIGAYAVRCDLAELGQLLQRYGPLAPQQTGNFGERLGAVSVAAAISQRAALRLEEAGLREAFVQSVGKMVKDTSVDIRQYVGRAIGCLVAAELESSVSQPSSPSLPTASSIIVALLGPDQHGEVHKQAMAVLRKWAVVGDVALQPVYPDIVPSILSRVQDSTGSAKLAAERTLGKVLRVEQGLETAQAFLTSGKAGPLARQMLTEATLRRLSRLLVTDEDDLADYAI